MRNKFLPTILLVFFCLTQIAQGQAALTVEAESGTTYGNAMVSDQTSGYTGTGYVEGFSTDADSLVIQFNVTATGLYSLNIRYHTQDGEKETRLTVNEETANVLLPDAPVFSEAIAGSFELTSGVNKIKVEKNWGYYVLDHFSFLPVINTAPRKPESKSLVNANATCEALALYSYLYDTYGTQVLAGQQIYDNMSDIDYVYRQTGKYPAVAGFDLIKYSPSRRIAPANDDPKNFVDTIIQWTKKLNGRGIATLAWHWSAPADLLFDTAAGKRWYDGHYEAASAFEFAPALEDTNLVNYQLILRDIDSIAIQLKKLQAEKIPILWRPLHEVTQGGFWWGAEGAAPFKKLWQLLYFRLTTHHQINNLIWVYTGPTDTSYYPGDKFVDIVGADIYNVPFEASLSNDWTAFQKTFGDKKLMALTEAGILPIAEKIKTYATWWSWAVPWNGFIQKVPADILKSAYDSEEYITLDELPDWKGPEESCVTGTNQSLSREETKFFPNPASHYLNIVANNLKDVEVLNSLGQTVIHAEKLEEGKVLNVEYLRDGIYYLKGTTHDNKMWIKSFVKMK